MGSIRLLIATVATVGFLTSPVSAHEHGHAHGEHKHEHNMEGLHIKAPWIRSTAPGVPSSAAYFIIKNNTDKDISLTAAKSDIAERVEIHEHSMKDGLMKMQQVNGIVIPKQSSTEFKPGGYHVMFMGLKDSVKEGQKVSIILVFDDGSEQRIQAVAKKKATDHSHEHKHH